MWEWMGVPVCIISSSLRVGNLRCTSFYCHTVTIEFCFAVFERFVHHGDQHPSDFLWSSYGDFSPGGFVFHFFFCTHSSAQKEKKYNSKVLVGDESELLDNAEFYFSEKNYTRALPLFLIIDEAHPEEHYFKYMAGQCCISTVSYTHLTLPTNREG